MASYGRYYHNDRWSGLGTSSFFSSLSAFTGIFLLLGFLSIGLAAGVFYLAELAEEYTQMTRKIISILIKAITILYVFLLLVDGLPLFCILCGVAAHVLYYQLLRTFPFVDLGSYEFLGSSVVGFVSAALWLLFFWRDPRCSYVSIEWATGFMVLMVFLVPFLFAISLTTPSHTLPFSTDASAQAKIPGKKRSAYILSLFRRGRDQVLPTVSRRQT